MSVLRHSPHHRRGCRVLGASFVAAAALPLLGMAPLAQANPGQGHGSTAAQGRSGDHARGADHAQSVHAQSVQAQSGTSSVSKSKGSSSKASGKASGMKQHGQEKVLICHATNSDTNPYVVITVSVASVKFHGHLAHRNTPNKTWKRATTWNGTTYAAGSPKRDLISDTRTTKYDGHVTAAYCAAHGTSTPTTPTPTTTTTTPSGTTTTTTGTTTTTSTISPTVSGTTTTTSGTISPTVSGTKATASTGSSTSPGAQVLPTKFTNGPGSGSSVVAGAGTQVLGEKVSALPRTGADVGAAALLSMLLLAAGGVLLRVSGVRRPRRTH